MFCNHILAAQEFFPRDSFELRMKQSLRPDADLSLPQPVNTQCNGQAGEHRRCGETHNGKPSQI